MSAPVPVDAIEQLRTARFGRFHLMLVVGVMLSMVFDGYDTLNPSYVIHYTAKPWQLSHSATGLMVASGLIGFLVGALAHGPVADRIGRRPVLLGALFGTGLLSLLTAVAANGFGSFILLRLLTGLFLGVIMPLGTAFVNEFAPARSANRVVAVTIAGYCLGGVLASLVGIYITPHLGWHSLYWIGAAPLVLGLLLLPLLPESVQFQVLRGRHEDVAKTLAKIRPGQDYGGVRFLQPRERASAREMIGTVVGRPFRRTSIALWVCAFMILFCIYGLSGWLPSVMESRGNDFAASFFFLAILQLAGIVGGITVAIVCDRRRGGLAVGLVVLMVVAAVAVLLVGVSTGSAAQLVFTGFAGFGIIGGQSVLDTLSAQTYPAHLRSTGTGMMFGVGRVGGILGPYLIGWLLDWTGGATGVVFVVMVVATSVAAVTGGALVVFRRGIPSTVDSLSATRVPVS
ncbi:MFS transporter [Amycolatopsis acidiphila]|uniref:MFS transporter n=1 Tax=Amycolatopsis acidiphila TaxID=715473 RepID=A0A558A5L4_9PSEU|nr:MFS transporter [Amycolatopsis acidiphila]TVT19518.1 MFS transporter [Amycolatopsis acidiphila]UIJ56891.1 MFS transporter [Amycolatopsis acidiphila]GHG54533.1 MFS transporter [Amycolatopsis acidiphila]